jgi:hypothetical protein
LGEFAKREDLSFVSRYLPRLLSEATRDELFTQTPEVEGLEAFGALPKTRRQSVLIEALEGLVLPGLEQVGVCVQPAREWLQGRLAA